MGLTGKKLNEDLVMFGEPLPEKALRALERGSPTADQIIKSLPPTAFLPAPTRSAREIAVEEAKTKKELELEVVASAQEQRQKRLDAKKELAKKKRQIRQDKKQNKKLKTTESPSSAIEAAPTIIETIISTKQTVKEPPNMNLEDELKALESDVKPKQKEVAPQAAPEEMPQVELKDQILELLSGEEDPPTLELINAWKETYGKNGIHVMAFGEGDVYVYHHLTRGEWKKIKELMAKMRESENADEVEEKLKEKVVLYCILWPSVDDRWLDYCKAGILDSLYQMILLNSGFLTPQQAMLLTTQL